MADELAIIPKSERTPTPTMRDLAAVFFRQRGLFLLSFLGISVGVLLYGFLSPRYEAQMKIMVRHGRVDPVVTPTPSSSTQFGHDEITEEELNSEVELLHDQEILRTVVEQAGLGDGRPSWLRRVLVEGEEAHIARAVRRLDQRLSVSPVRKATLISVTCRSSDPSEASRTLKALSAAYLERHSQVRRPSGEFNFFEQQAVTARQGLRDAETELINFTNNEELVSAAQERDMALQRLSETEANERQAHVALKEVAQRIGTLESKLRSLPERVTTDVRNSDNPLLLQKLKSTLLDLELKRTELLTKYEPSYRLVKEVDQQIAETKAAIVAEDQVPLRDETTALDPDRQWVKAELVKSQVEFSSLSARLKAMGVVLSGYRESAHRFGDRAIKQDELVRSLKEAEEKYLLYVNKREEARISDALDQGGILNVAIVQAPIAPALPARSALTLAGFGLLLAGTVSTTMAFAADYLDPAFRTPDEIVLYLGAPVLASLPRKHE